MPFNDTKRQIKSFYFMITLCYGLWLDLNVGFDLWLANTFEYVWTGENIKVVND